MKDIELFNKILMWLRYVLETRISELYPQKDNFDVYTCPNGFPKISTKTVEFEDTFDLNRYIDTAKAYQEKRKLFHRKLTTKNPGFYVNFISKDFVISIIAKYLLDIEGIEVKTKNLFIPNFVNKNLYNHEDFYENDDDQALLIGLMKETNLYLKSFKLIIDDGLRGFEIKAIEHDGIIAFWEPTFKGSIVFKNDPKNISKFFKSIAHMSYNDIITLVEKTRNIEKLNVIH